MFVYKYNLLNQIINKTLILSRNKEIKKYIRHNLPHLNFDRPGQKKKKYIHIYILSY